MSTKPTKQQENETKDMLEDIFVRQRDLMLKLGIIFRDSDGWISTDGVADSLALPTMLVCTRAIMHEIVELEDELGWKPWELEPKKIDWARVRDELIDVQHFIMEIAILAGMTPYTFHMEYKRKNEINHKRADKEYVPFAKKQKTSGKGNRGTN